MDSSLLFGAPLLVLGSVWPLAKMINLDFGSHALPSGGGSFGHKSVQVGVEHCCTGHNSSGNFKTPSPIPYFEFESGL